MDVLPYYQEIAALSGQMRVKAEAREWGDLHDFYTRYRQAVERLDALPPLDDHQKDARRTLLLQILDDDARIRALLAPELERLGHLLGNAKRERSVLDAYRPADPLS